MNIDENIFVGVECNGGTRLRRRSDLLDLTQRDTARVLLNITLAVAADFGFQIVGQRIDATHPYAVQSARYLVRAFIELTSCVQNGHHYLQSRFFLFLVYIDRDTATIVLDSNGVILIYRNRYIFAISCQGFVDRVVNHLINKMMQTFLPHIAYVHCRAFTYRLEPLEHLDRRGSVFFI